MALMLRMSLPPNAASDRLGPKRQIVECCGSYRLVCVSFVRSQGKSSVSFFFVEKNGDNFHSLSIGQRTPFWKTFPPWLWTWKTINNQVTSRRHLNARLADQLKWPNSRNIVKRQDNKKRPSRSHMLRVTSPANRSSFVWRRPLPSQPKKKK